MGRHWYNTNICPSSDNACDEIRKILDVCEAEVTLYVTADFHAGGGESYDSDGVCIDPSYGAEAEVIEVEPEKIVFHGLKSVFGSNPEIEHYLTDANGTPELLTVTAEIKKKIMEIAKEEFIKNWDDHENDAWNSYQDHMMGYEQ